MDHSLIIPDTRQTSADSKVATGHREPRSRRREARMFWSMRYAATSSIDTIIEREGGFTLEELLEEDELLQECKSQNTKLLELCVHRPFRCAPPVVPTPHPSPPQFVRA